MCGDFSIRAAGVYWRRVSKVEEAFFDGGESDAVILGHGFSGVESRGLTLGVAVEGR
jgi:hypothetical protein